MALLLFVSTAIIASSAVSLAIVFSDINEGKKYNTYLKTLSKNYKPSYWENKAVSGIAHNEGEAFFAFQTGFGFVTFCRKEGDEWDISVAYSTKKKPFLQFTYQASKKKIKRESWDRKYLDGRYGFLLFKRGEFPMVAQNLKSSLLQHVHELIRQEKPEMAQEKKKKNKRKTIYEKILSRLESGKYTVKREVKELFYREKGRTVITFEFDEDTMIRWIKEPSTEIFERIHDGKNLYSVQIDKESQQVRHWKISHENLKDIDDEETFAHNEKRLWDAVKEAWEKQRTKKQTIQDVWNGKSVPKPLPVWKVQEKEILDKMLSFTPFVQRLSSEDAWYLSKKVPERLKNVRQLRMTDSVTEEQMGDIFRQIKKRLDAIEETVQKLQHTEGERLVRLTNED